MGVISNIYKKNNVAIISFEKSPARIDFLSELFNRVAGNQINVDMISQTTPKGEYNTISFSVEDDKVGLVLQIIKSLKERFSEIVPMVTIGNVKISLYGEEMPSKVGVAADVFKKLQPEGIDILLITTSDVDISIVVTDSNSEKAYKILENAYLSE